MARRFVPEFRGVIAVAVVAVLVGMEGLARDITTNDGVTYKDVKIVEVTPIAISVLVNNKVVEIDFVDLPKEIQDEFKYDPDNAAGFEEAMSEQVSKMREKLDSTSPTAQSSDQAFPPPSPVTPVTPAVPVNQLASQDSQSVGGSDSTTQPPTYPPTTEVVYGGGAGAGWSSPVPYCWNNQNWWWYNGHYYPWNHFSGGCWYNGHYYPYHPFGYRHDGHYYPKYYHGGTWYHGGYYPHPHGLLGPTPRSYQGNSYHRNEAPKYGPVAPHQRYQTSSSHGEGHASGGHGGGGGGHGGGGRK